MTANEFLLDESVMHAVRLTRLSKGEAERVAEVLTSAFEELSAEINRRVANITAPGQRLPSPQRTRRLQQIREHVKAELDKIAIEQTISANLMQAGLTEADFQATILQRSLPAGVQLDFSTPSRRILRSAISSMPFQGAVLKKWSKGIEQGVIDGVQTSITQGLTVGESNADIARRVKKTLNTSVRQATTVTRTAVNHVVTQARESTFQDNSRFIRSVRWVSTLDTRTSLICMSLDGEVYKVGEGRRPPAHFNCRSTTVPVLKGWRELGLKEPPASTRASLDGQVPEKLSYSQWLRKQSASRQNEALGLERAKLFRKGLPIDKFLDRNLSPINVAQLRDLEGLD